MPLPETAPPAPPPAEPGVFPLDIQRHLDEYALEHQRVVAGHPPDPPYGERTVPDRLLADRQFTARDIEERRRCYKLLDGMLSWQLPWMQWWLWGWLFGWLKKKFPLRHVPRECSLTAMNRNAPSLEGADADSVAKFVWDRMYAEAAALVRHDDALNWSKFNNMVILNGALIAGFATAGQYKMTALLVLLPLLGVLIGWYFDFTLQEGMRCLRAHRQKVRALDRVAIRRDDPGREFLFVTNAYNHRDALEIGPLLFTTAWVIMGMYQLYWAVVGWATQPPPTIPHILS